MISDKEANFYHENARITKTRHQNSYGQQKIPFRVSKIDNEITVIFSSDSWLLESEFFFGGTGVSKFSKSGIWYTMVYLKKIL